jgi:hypothetical protein
MRSRPSVDVALTGTALYQPCMVCSEDVFRPRLGVLRGTPNYGTRHISTHFLSTLPSHMPYSLETSTGTRSHYRHAGTRDSVDLPSDINISPASRRRSPTGLPSSMLVLVSAVRLPR